MRSYWSRENGFVSSQRGYSMYPLIVPGRDEVFVERVSPESLRRGDVVLYRRRDGSSTCSSPYLEEERRCVFFGGRQSERNRRSP